VGGETNWKFLELISNETNPSNFSKLSPIFLCNTTYKILTKIIANCIKPLLPKLILENQGGFMEKKQITNNIILVQEVIHSSWITKDKGTLIKLDIENAFD